MLIATVGALLKHELRLARMGKAKRSGENMSLEWQVVAVAVSALVLRLLVSARGRQ
jgi:hypothetical protein